MNRWPYPRLLGHRGGGILAPENTLAGFDVAAQRGYRGVECDAMLSLDGTPYVIHDETLERTTNGSGRTADAGDALLDQLDAGAWFGARYAGEPVPRLETAAARLQALGLWLNLEIKPTAGVEAATGRAVAALASRLWAGAALAPLLSSFSEEALAAAASVAPELPRGLLVSAVPADWQERLQRHGCAALHFDAARVSLAEIDLLRDGGWWLVAYTVNDPTLARRLLDAGVDAVITDRLDAIPAAWA